MGFPLPSQRWCYPKWRLVVSDGFHMCFSSAIKEGVSVASPHSPDHDLLSSGTVPSRCVKRDCRCKIAGFVLQFFLKLYCINISSPGVRITSVSVISAQRLVFLVMPWREGIVGTACGLWPCVDVYTVAHCPCVQINPRWGLALSVQRAWSHVHHHSWYLSADLSHVSMAKELSH